MALSPWTPSTNSISNPMHKPRLQQQKLKRAQVFQVLTQKLTGKPLVRKYSSISKYAPQNPCHLKSQLKTSTAIFIYDILNQEGALCNTKENGSIRHCPQTLSKPQKAGENLLLDICQYFTWFSHYLLTDLYSWIRIVCGNFWPVNLARRFTDCEALLYSQVSS